MLARAAILLLKILLKGYKLIISPWLPNACRFTPTCSEYAAEAIARHGPGQGLILALKRMSKCHPWGGAGHDPVP